MVSSDEQLQKIREDSNSSSENLIKAHNNHSDEELKIEVSLEEEDEDTDDEAYE